MPADTRGRLVSWQREATSLAKVAAIKAVTSAQGAEAKALKVEYEARLKAERKIKTRRWTR